MKRRLRGHHLICLHFYKGKGYSSEFVENLNHLMREIVSDGAIVVSGADDVCSACPHLKGDVCKLSESSDAEVTGMDELALSLLNVEVGHGVNWTAIRDRLHQFIHQWHDRCCSSCQWFGLCEVKTQIERKDIAL